MNLEKRKNLKYSAGNVTSTKLNTVQYSIIRLSSTTLKLTEYRENLHSKTIFSVTITTLDMTFLCGSYINKADTKVILSPEKQLFPPKTPKPLFWSSTL